MDSVPSIADLLERVPSWVGRAVTWQRLEGGLSHHIYRVDVDGRPHVLRVLDPAVSAVGLGIEPAQEIANTLLAAGSGVGPRVYDVLADVPAIVIEFLPGRTLGLGARTAWAAVRQGPCHPSASPLPIAPKPRLG